MRKIVLSIGIVSALCFSAPNTFAQCTCWPKLTLREEFERSDAVFVGEVIEAKKILQETDSYVTVVKVEVKQAWKQDLERFVILKDFPEVGISNRIEPNQEWLFFAHKIKNEDGTFVAWHCCSRTKLLSGAAEDLKQFRKMGEKPKKIIDRTREAEQSLAVDGAIATLGLAQSPQQVLLGSFGEFLFLQASDTS